MPVDHARDLLIDEFTEELLVDIQATKRPHTVKSLAHEWKHFVKWAKPTRLKDVTPRIVADYKRHLLRQDKANSTVRSSLLALSSIFSTAISEMHCFDEVNPVKGIKLPKPGQNFPRYLELDDIEGLLETSKAHGRDMHLIMALGVFAGLRKNELVHAR